jgi:hypothetical protein
MSEELKELVRMTRDSGRTLGDLLPIYRQAISDADAKVRAFAVDSVLIRASIAHSREWETFAEQLGPADAYLRCVSWLGRTRTPLQGTLKFDRPGDDETRRETILWLIDHYPDARIHGHVEAGLNSAGDEPAFDIGKSVWLKKVIEAPENVDVLSNAARFCAFREPEIACALVLTCIKLQPRVERWRRLLVKILKERKSAIDRTR